MILYLHIFKIDYLPIFQMLSQDYYVIEKFAQCSNQNDLGNCFHKFCKKFFKTARRLTDRCYITYNVLQIREIFFSKQ